MELKEKCRIAEERAAVAIARAETAEYHLESATKELNNAARRLIKADENGMGAAGTAWDVAWNNRSVVDDYRDRIRRCRPLLGAGMCVEGNDSLNRTCSMIADIFDAFEPEEVCLGLILSCASFLFLY